MVQNKNEQAVVRNKPIGAVRYGKCPGPFCDGEEEHWLFNSDCADEPWCEGCIEEAHARVNEALDFMNDPISDEEIAEMDAEQNQMEADYDYF